MALKEVHYAYMDSGDNLTNEKFIINTDEIQTIKKCYNDKCSEIFLKGGKSFTVSIPYNKLIELLNLDK